MASRVVPTNTAIVKFAPAGVPDVTSAAANVKGLTTDAFEVWGDGSIWDTTTNLPVCIDKLNITGTPRKRL